MAVVGHWTSLAEAQKLTQTVLLQGVVETVINRGLMLPMMGVKMVRGKSLTYNREKSFTTSAGADFYSIHQQIPWVADVDYQTQVEVELKRIARADAIDRFMSATYLDHNDYEAVVVQELIKRTVQFTEDKLIYGDKDNTSDKEFDGLHALITSIESSATDAGVAAEGKINVNAGTAALSLEDLRRLLDACKVDQLGRENVAILMPRAIARRFDAGYQEAGFVRASTTIALGQLQIGAKDLGGRIMMFDGVPIIRSDFLVAEQENTGESTSSARTKYASSTRVYSIFVVRFGSVEDGGLEILFGDSEAQNGEFKPFRHEVFDKLENFDAGGHRLIGYLAPALGAGHSLGRIYDITDVALLP